MVLSENAEELPLADMEKSKPTRKKMEWGEKKDRVRGTNKTKEKHTHLRLHHVRIKRREALETLI